MFRRVRTVMFLLYSLLGRLLAAHYKLHFVLYCIDLDRYGICSAETIASVVGRNQVLEQRGRRRENGF
jgi:hypothetical protein